MGGRGGDAPPPEPTARRLLAAAVLAALLIGAVTWGTRSDEKAQPGIEPPFAFGPVSGIDAFGGRARVPATGDRVLLYVSETCPACARELAAWDSGLREHGTGPPRVLVAPGSDPTEATWIPPSLREGRVHDPSGRIAKALGVRAVPFVAVLDDQGNVVEARVGMSSPEALTTLLALLRPVEREAP